MHGRSSQPCLHNPITAVKPASKADLITATEACLKLSNDCSKGANAPIWDWDVTAVTDMSQVFVGESDNKYYVSGAERFDGDISKWDVSRVTSMFYMFSGAKAFNGDISKWDVSRVTNMQDMFARASAFNGDISKWNVGSVTNMRGVFFLATSFNGDISKWDVSRVTNMISMFQFAESFSQTLCGASAVSTANKAQMFEGSKGKMCSSTCLCVRGSVVMHIHVCITTC